MNNSTSTVSNILEKVNTLLTTNLKKILRNELHNENRVNLYSVGEYWAAFEKSAYLLKQMVHEDDSPVLLYVKGHPFPIVMQNMHYKQINEMCKKHIMTKKRLEFLQFITHPIDESSYARWYREHVIDEGA